MKSLVDEKWEKVVKWPVRFRVTNPSQHLAPPSGTSRHSAQEERPPLRPAGGVLRPRPLWGRRGALERL